MKKSWFIAAFVQRTINSLLFDPATSTFTLLPITTRARTTHNFSLWLGWAFDFRLDRNLFDYPSISAINQFFQASWT
jgi:hypothetical protein